MRQLETVFPCSRIFYLCLESLGLDITSVIFNRFKKRQQHTPFCDFFLSKNHTNNWFLHDTLLIERVLPILKNFPFGFLKFLELDPFDFYIKKYTYEVCSTLLIGINPRPLPLRNKYFLLELHHVLFTLQLNKKHWRGL